MAIRTSSNTIIHDLPSDFADQFPNAKVTGTDISPIQPYWTPPNLQFEIDDATLEWTYRPGTFDYVHMRYLLGAIIDWNELFRQAYRSLRPGGWLESYEAAVTQESDDGSVEEGSAMDQWGKLFHEAGRKTGRSFRVYEDRLQKKAMEAAGFVDIQVWEFKVRTFDQVSRRVAAGSMAEGRALYDVYD